MTHNETVQQLRDRLDALTAEHFPNLLCQQAPDLYFPDEEDSKIGNYAKQLNFIKKGCESCPIQRECAGYAIAAGEEWGIWGGTSPNERRAMRRRLGIPSRAERLREHASVRPLD